MRPFGTLLAGIAFLAAGVLLPGCMNADPLVSVDAALFAPTFGGDIGLSNTTMTDVASVDLDSDLDLGGTDYVPYVRAEFDFGPLNAMVNGFQTTQKGDGTVTADFGGISAGSTVTTDLDLTMAHGRLVFDLLDMDVLTAGVGLAANWVDMELEARETTFGVDESLDLEQIVPLLAAHVATRIDVPMLIPLRFDLNAAGIALDYKDIDGTMLDLEALLHGELGHFGVFAGYRYVMMDVEGVSSGQEYDGDVTLSGWLIGLNVRF